MASNLITGGDGANTLNGSGGADLIYGFNPDGPQGTVSSIAATRVASGLTQPLFAGAPPDDGSRLFIVEKTGQIKILDLNTGQVLATPFLDLSGEINTSGERGLLGLAFDPDFASNGYVYVNLINVSGDTEVRRYQVSSGNPNVADPASATAIISIEQPSATNHKAGWLGFGPDGYLYVASGDGGSNAASAQDVDSLLGKILRLDVASDAFPADPARNYALPADNMFVGVAGADEIFASGLRNPWRPSFDRGLGDFYIADVGASTWEEIDLGALGANYGWNVYEGPDVAAGGTPSAGTLTAPIHYYSHSVGQSITGGYVYRGLSEGLHGQYFFADFVASKIFTLHFNGSAWVATERTAQITPSIGTINNPSSFGEDGFGNLYVVDFGGEVFRLTPTVTSADQGDTLNGLGGDDIIFGGSGNDRLDGGSGNDRLIGGLGDDAFVYAPGGGADVIVDFTPGAGNVDRIDLTAFTEIDTLADVLARATQVGANTVIDFGSGNTLTLQNVQKSDLRSGDFIGLSLLPAANDFNADAMSDILWRNGDGRVGIWEMNGRSPLWAGTVGDAAQDWRMVDTGDFGADGKADILLRNDADGRVGLWEMSGRSIAWAGTIASLDNGWRLTDTADLDGDGKADILLRDARDGRVGLWEMNGRSIAWAGTIAAVSLGWHIAETGDFNGDGKADILWRNDDGRVGLWEMNGSTPSWAGTIATLGNNWQIADTGDFNADGRAEILLRDTSDGRVGIWELGGHALAWSGTVGTADASWQIARTGDLNGDGAADILWRNDDGRLGLWEINGRAIAWAGTIATVDNSWQVAAHHDWV